MNLIRKYVVFLGVMIYLLQYPVPAFGQNAPTNIWEAQVQAEVAFKQYGVSMPVPQKKEVLSTKSATLEDETYIVLRSNIGEFSNASPAVQVFVDVLRETDFPVRINGRISKRTAEDWIVQGYLVPPGTDYGRIERLNFFTSYELYDATIPEARFGDTYIFEVLLFDDVSGEVLQYISTRFMVGGDSYGHRGIFHLDKAVYSNGFVYLQGSFPMDQEMLVRLGAPRGNRSGPLRGEVVSPNLAIVPFVPILAVTYAYPLDVVVLIPLIQESFSLPGGLKMQPGDFPAPPPLPGVPPSGR